MERGYEVVMAKASLETVFKRTFLNWWFLCLEKLFPKHYCYMVPDLPISLQNAAWQECSQNLGSLPAPMLLVYYCHSNTHMSGACWVSMGTGVQH